MVALRSRADDAVTPLFDWSGAGPVEPRLLLLLQQTENQLQSLASLVFSLSLQNATPTTEQVFGLGGKECGGTVVMNSCLVGRWDGVWRKR